MERTVDCVNFSHDFRFVQKQKVLEISKANIFTYFKNILNIWLSWHL